MQCCARIVICEVHLPLDSSASTSARRPSIDTFSEPSEALSSHWAAVAAAAVASPLADAFPAKPGSVVLLLKRRLVLQAR
jgi:hypothetical protein